MEQLIKKSVKLAVIVTVVAGAILLVMGKYLWAMGILTGSVWMIINFILTINLFKIALLKDPKSKLSIFILIKFPLLYLLLLLLLTSSQFSIIGILIGMSFIFVSLGVVKYARITGIGS